MKRILFALLAICLFQVVNAQQSDNLSSSRLLKFEGSVVNNKVILDWSVGLNQVADKFEVEKSLDGVNFTMAALVFGTDKPDTDHYRFYEKAGSQKIIYRIKLVDKDGGVAYSQVLVVG